MAGTKHTLVALVEDKPGVLNRMASLCRRRGFNIESIAVGHTETPRLSRMTIVVDGTTTMIEQLRKQLDKNPRAGVLSSRFGCSAELCLGQGRGKGCQQDSILHQPGLKAREELSPGREYSTQPAG